MKQKKAFKQSVVKLGVSCCFLFQHDNHLKQTSLLVNNHLQKTTVNVIEWLVCLESNRKHMG